MKMSEAELKSLLASEQAAALGYLGGTLSKERREAMKYYNGEKFGNEAEGRSQVVTTEVADTIEWMLPALLKIFTAGDDVVTADPNGAEDEETAEQITEYANFQFYRVNPGFIILHTMFKDALLQKTGICKVYWEEKEKFEQKEFVSIPDEQFMGELAQYQGEGWELENYTTEPGPPDEMGEPSELHSGNWTRTIKKGDVCIDPVPPEEFLISRNAKTIADAAYVAHRSQKTASELLEAGYKKSVVDSLPADEVNDDQGEREARYRGIDDAPDADNATANTAMRRIWVTESYIKLDWDDDGIAEMRKITHAGSGTVILDNEEWEGPRPFCGITPIIMSHRFYGKSVADLVMDLQLIKSTLLRQILDNLYLSNNSQKVVNPDNVEIDDLLVSRPGGLIRTKNGARPSDVLTPLEVPPVAAASFPMLEYLDTVKENRTGVTRYNQGIDANSLNKTASGITQIMSASQQRIELIARVFAETGIKDIFKHVFWLLRKYPDQAKRTIRLRNKEWVEMDPATWGEDYDFTINVGLGTGNKDQMLGHLMTIAQSQREIVGFQGGTNGPIVTLDNVYNTLAKMVENAGFKNVSEFYTDPGKNPAPPEPPKPDPAAEKVKAEIDGMKAKMQLESEKAQADIQAKQQASQMQAQADEQAALREFRLKEKLALMEFELKKQLAIADMQLKQGIAQQQAQDKRQMDFANNEYAKSQQAEAGEADD